VKSGRTGLHVLSRREDMIGGYRGRLVNVSCQIQLRRERFTNMKVLYESRPGRTGDLQDKFVQVLDETHSAVA